MAPQNIRVHFHHKLAHVSWHGVPGAVKYAVRIDKVGYDCPCVSYSTKSTSMDIAYGSFPYKSQPGSYRVRVTAYGALGHTATSSVRFQTKVAGIGVAVSATAYAGAKASGAVGVTVSTESGLDAAAKKANSCLKQGEAAGLAVAAGGGILVAVTSWIPGVDAVTAGSVAQATAATTSGKFVYCMASGDW